MKNERGYEIRLHSPLVRPRRFRNNDSPIRSVSRETMIDDDPLAHGGEIQRADIFRRK